MEEQEKEHTKREKRVSELSGVEMSDSWMLDMVDDPETDLALSKLAVENGVEELGMSREDAVAAFMPPEPEPDIELEDLLQMQSDILRGEKEPHIKTRKGSEAWSSLKQEIDEIKARGGVVDFPAL